MKKINLKGISETLSEKELKNVMGGSGSSNGCPTGQTKCICNGADKGCVSSLQACWNKC
ncbi:MAG: bacteriocin [Bacteroides sp.]|nr:bacteriocin [Bacteroides sp.]